jgi:hypothetical protein
MTSSNRNCRFVAGVTVALLSAVAFGCTASVALSQQPTMKPDQMSGHDEKPVMMHMHGQQEAEQTSMFTPTMPGQDAFGAIQEIVRLLEADPNTDWSKVDLEGLRQHLIDMNEVTLKADAAVKPIDGGLQIAITGDSRTRAAIQRMVPAHAHELDQLNNWSASSEPLPDGVLLTVTSSDNKEAQRIRGLGFIGLFVTGSHHQPHHLAMAKGELSHQD